MRKKGGIKKVLLLFIVLIVVSILFFNNFQPAKGLRIINWDNIYNENNIIFFYEDLNITENKDLVNLNNVYRIKELTSEGKTEIDNVLKGVDILNSIVEYDDVEDSNLTSAYEIIKFKNGSKKVTGREMAVIQRDILICAGLKSRIGEFRKEEPQFKQSPSYYVVEYFSEEYNKWVMVDFRNRAYYSEDNVPLAAIEIIDSNINKLDYEGKNEFKDIVNEFKQYLSSYTIFIDNTHDMNRSNSCVTYISSEKDIDLMKHNKYLSPTIFTEKKQLFLNKPANEKELNDKKAYLIFFKRQTDEEDKLTYVLGAFKNDTVINNYYLRINDGEWQKIDNMYYEYNFALGKTKIELSLNGKDVVSKVEINREK